MSRCLLYGANGYTGRKLLEAALGRGLSPIVAGRNAQEAQKLAETHKLEHRSADLRDAAALDRMLRNVDVLLNSAGPFCFTAPPLVDACLRHGVHYLDITGEAMVIEQTALRASEARQRQVMLMSGVGFDVVASDCLAGHLARRSRNPAQLRIGLSGLTWPSRGSAKTMVEILDQPVWARRDGALCPVPAAAKQHCFDYGAGLRPSVAVPWGDVSSAYFSTGIPNITTYFEATAAVRMHTSLVDMFGWAMRVTPWQAWLNALSVLLPNEPFDPEFARRQAVIVAEVEDERGRSTRARLRTPEVYTFTAEVATDLLLRALRGDVEPGFQTACRMYGPDFVLRFTDVSREDL
jgi:short subunit dehydrogenase-like uncharacterized protein